MTAKDWSREIAAISPYVSGASFELRGNCAQPIPGVGQTIESSGSGLASLADQSADTIVSIGGLAASGDAIATLRGIRRVLRESAQLVMVARNIEYSPQYLASLIVLVSGFEIAEIEEVVPGETYVVVCRRNVVNEVRQPFGVHGPGIVAKVAESTAARAEYYFQVGTLMLQTGDPELAVQCFRNVLGIEPNNAEAYFGLGMTYGTQSRWTEALFELQRSRSLDANNTEVARWIQLAEQHLQQTPTQHSQDVAAPVAATQIAIPQVAPAPTETCAPAHVSAPGAMMTPSPSGVVAGQGGATPVPPQPIPTVAQTCQTGSLRI